MSAVFNSSLASEREPACRRLPAPAPKRFVNFFAGSSGRIASAVVRSRLIRIRPQQISASPGRTTHGLGTRRRPFLAEGLAAPARGRAGPGPPHRALRLGDPAHDDSISGQDRSRLQHPRHRLDGLLRRDPLGARRQRRADLRRRPLHGIPQHHVCGLALVAAGFSAMGLSAELPADAAAVRGPGFPRFVCRVSACDRRPAGAGAAIEHCRAVTHAARGGAGLPGIGHQRDRRSGRLPGRGADRRRVRPSRTASLARRSWCWDC